MTCELCKEPFKSIVNHQGKTIHLLDYQKPESSHWIVFEALNTENLFDEQIKIFHVFDFHNLSMLSLGRGHAADAKISDISISRIHWYLQIINNEIWIEDANSKFGSLYLQKNPYYLKPNADALKFQVGRTFFEVQILDNSLSSCWTQWFLPDVVTINGFDFELFPEEFPIEIQKLYYSRETRLNKVLQDDLEDHHDFNTSFAHLQDTFNHKDHEYSPDKSAIFEVKSSGFSGSYNPRSSKSSKGSNSSSGREEKKSWSIAQSKRQSAESVNRGWYISNKVQSNNKLNRLVQTIQKESMKNLTETLQKWENEVQGNCPREEEKEVGIKDWFSIKYCPNDPKVNHNGDNSESEDQILAQLDLDRIEGFDFSDRENDW